MGTFRRGYVILVSFQSFNDLLGGLIVRRLPLSIQFGQRLLQTEDTDFRIINKLQFVPTNCRLWRDSAPTHSPLLVIKLEIFFMFVLRHIAPRYLFVMARVQEISQGSSPINSFISIPTTRPDIQLLRRRLN
jgi:hypothetical protein